LTGRPYRRNDWRHQKRKRLQKRPKCITMDSARR
jgi:hypothetical protein